ncbi:MAG: hypothetical protein ACK5XD_05330, partial [Acidobacteriota bacterium]
RLRAAIKGRDEVIVARQLSEQYVFVHPLINHCLVDTARNLRAHKKVLQGLSTRSLVLMIPALQSMAMLAGRDYVTPQDIYYLAPYVFGHRLVIAPGVGEMKKVVHECLAEPLEQLTRMTLAGQAPVATPPADPYPAGPVN